MRRMVIFWNCGNLYIGFTEDPDWMLVIPGYVWRQA